MTLARIPLDDTGPAYRQGERDRFARVLQMLRTRQHAFLRAARKQAEAGEPKRARALREMADAVRHDIEDLRACVHPGGRLK